MLAVGANLGYHRTHNTMSTILSYLETAWLILLVILFFNVMIFVHELGHFLAGKWRGAYIDRFQIWFGKPIWQKKIGGVQWGLGWIPAGGFVSLPQLADMQAIEGEADIPKDLKPLKPLDKVIIAAAGPLFSLLLAYVFACVVWGVGNPVYESSATIGYVHPTFTVGEQGTEKIASPAAAAGLQAGDTVLAVNGNLISEGSGKNSINKWARVRELIALSPTPEIKFTVDRNGQTLDLICDCRPLEKYSTGNWWSFGRSGLRQVGIAEASPAVIGTILPGSPAEKAGLTPGQRITALNGNPIFSPAEISVASTDGKEMELTLDNGTTCKITPVLPTNWKDIKEATPRLGLTWADTRRYELDHPTPQAQVNQSLKWMGDTISALAAPGSSVSLEHLSGPVGIGTHLYQMLQSENGWRLILWFAVVLNVNLAVLNILPLPIVDGGHVVLGTAEMILRRPVAGKILDYIQFAFFFCILAVFIFITFKDVGDAVGSGQLPEPVFTEK